MTDETGPQNLSLFIYIFISLYAVMLLFLNQQKLGFKSRRSLLTNWLKNKRPKKSISYELNERLSSPFPHPSSLPGKIELIKFHKVKLPKNRPWTEKTMREVYGFEWSLILWFIIFVHELQSAKDYQEWINSKMHSVFYLFRNVWLPILQIYFALFISFSLVHTASFMCTMPALSAGYFYSKSLLILMFCLHTRYIRILAVYN